MLFPKFIFITALTPPIKLDATRVKLYHGFLAALKNQTYDNWQVLMVGNEERIDGKMIYVKCSEISKKDKLLFAYEYIKNLSIKPDYLIRLDDDDIISPFVLERASRKGFDCYADKYHSFYEINQKLTAQQKRPWLANTVIHKMEHAMHQFGDNNLPLFTLDHSIYWHKYYKDKKIKWAGKRHPVYLRLLSPTSISANSYIDNEANDEYKKYLKGFGKWKKSMIKDFKNVQFPD